MPSSNSEIALRLFDAFNSGDWERATSVPPDFVWVNDELTVAVTGTPLEAKGPEELLAFWQAFFGYWEEWRMEPGEPVESASGRVFIPVQFTARGKESGVPIQWDYFHVWEFREGVPVKISNIRDREEALAAAGLAGQSSQPNE